MTLGVAQSFDDSLIAFAGINSSQAEQKRNNNQHLRSFKVDYPRAKLSTTASGAGETTVSKPEKSPQTTPLSRASLFRSRAKETGEPETYQRILRLSPWKKENLPRIAAIATSLAPQNEIVLFNANTPTPQESDVLGRVTLANQEETEDLDLLDIDSEGNFRFIYANGSSLSMCDLSSSKKAGSLEPRCIYTLPSDGAKKSKIRAVRFLSPTSFVLLINLPARSGCELVVVTLKGPKGSVARRRRIDKSIKIGVGLDVCHLTSTSNSDVQHIIAVSGNNQSIELLTLDYSPKNGYGKLYHYETFRDLHPFAMTKITFSHYIPPRHPVIAGAKPPYIKLASVSVGNTVTVHTLPLSPYPADSKRPRYVLVTPGPSEILQTIFSVIMALVVIALGAFFLQAFTEIRGGIPEVLGAKEWLPPRLRDLIAKPYMFAEGQPQQHRVYSLKWFDSPSTTSQTSEPPVVQTSLPLQSLLSSKDDSQTLVVQDHGEDVRVQAHTGEEGRSNARKWEDLPLDEREAWKTKLVDAGHWAVEEGEAILKGVFFGELAGFVGRAMV